MLASLILLLRPREDRLSCRPPLPPPAITPHPGLRDRRYRCVDGTARHISRGVQPPTPLSGVLNRLHRRFFRQAGHTLREAPQIDARITRNWRQDQNRWGDSRHRRSVLPPEKLVPPSNHCAPGGRYHCQAQQTPATEPQCSPARQARLRRGHSQHLKLLLCPSRQFVSLHQKQAWILVLREETLHGSYVSFHLLIPFAAMAGLRIDTAVSLDSARSNFLRARWICTANAALLRPMTRAASAAFNPSHDTSSNASRSLSERVFSATTASTRAKTASSADL